MNWDNNIVDSEVTLGPRVPTQCILHRKRFTLAVLEQLEGAVSTTAHVWNPQMLNGNYQLGQSAGQTLICLWDENKALGTKPKGCWCLEQAGTVQHILGSRIVPESCLFLGVSMTNTPMCTNSSTVGSTSPRGAEWSWPWMHRCKCTLTCVSGEREAAGLSREQQHVRHLAEGLRHMSSSQVRLSWQGVLWDLSAQPLNHPEPSPGAWRVPRAMAMSVSLLSLPMAHIGSLISSCIFSFSSWNAGKVDLRMHIQKTQH